MRNFFDNDFSCTLRSALKESALFPALPFVARACLKLCGVLRVVVL